MDEVIVELHLSNNPTLKRVSECQLTAVPWDFLTVFYTIKDRYRSLEKYTLKYQYCSLDSVHPKTDTSQKEQVLILVTQESVLLKTNTG
jgi:hypothetical protein